MTPYSPSSAKSSRQHCRHTVAALLLLLLIPLSALADMHISDSELERELISLDRAISRRSDYIGRRQARIDSMRADLNLNEKPAEQLMRIGREYTSFNNDSAIRYFSLGRQLATTGAERDQFAWSEAALLPLSGLFERATQLFDTVDPDSVAPALLPSYYEAGRQMHSYISTFFKDHPELDSIYTSKSLDFQQKLLEILPKNTLDYKYNLGEYYLLTGQRARAGLLLEEVFERSGNNGKLRARAAHHLAHLSRDNGDYNRYLYYMAVSALSDVTSATREVASLQELGSNIGSSGDVGRAHNYLSAALENAVECGAALRMIDTSRALPLIERSHSADMKRNNRYMIIIVIVLVLLLAGLGILFNRVRLQMHKMQLMEQTLRDANKTKEVYISQFLSLCSIYMDKLNQFCKIANRKLAAGQADDLYRMTKSGKFVEEQSREFYEVFDNAFLHIYPNFIEDVNALLRPDQRIVLREGELLNTDLRILAFMRLGIEDSPRIAQVLNYSLNTIYAYRNRLKARAINRDTFEEDVTKIQS
ncbi:MAG: hypothetical protein K2L96_03025 [Muribaculaceae bacterium]|nr:hypothetical protein [Muribaculaceae bacterium]